MNIADLRFELTSRIRMSEQLFFPLIQVSKRVRNTKGVPLVCSHTELVIEGYFRCANTFAALAFVQAQKRKTTIANHTHAAASIDRAVRLGLPTLVLIRQPSDVAVSHVMKHPGLSLTQSLKWYRRFYEHIWRHNGSILVADFANVTSDFGQVIQRVNQRFGTNFVPFVHSDENVAKIFDRIRSTDLRNDQNNINQLSIPSRIKDQKKTLLRQKLQSPGIKQWFDEACAVYDRYLALLT